MADTVKQNEPIQPKPVEKKKEKGEIPFSSNAIRLSIGLWAVAAVIVIAVVLGLPSLWVRLEKMETGPDARVPFSLGNDYWIFKRFSKAVCAPDKIAVIGDSVAWGHYVASTGTLSHFLSEKDGKAGYVNAAIDGVHPLALEGLIRYYGCAIRDRKVIIQLNPLWMTDDKKDLSSKKDMQINHPKLIPQFSKDVLAYKEDKFAERLAIVIKHKIDFAAWAEHIRIAYFSSTKGPSLFKWAIENPYRNPRGAVTIRLPSGEPIPPETEAIPWSKSTKYGQFDPDWVELDKSLQWAAFRRTIDLLKSRGNNVFVLVGPYNEHMIKENGREKYRSVVAGYRKWLEENKVKHLVAETLPSDMYADSSHPLADGYAAVADQLLKNAEFRAFVETGLAR